MANEPTRQQRETSYDVATTQALEYLAPLDGKMPPMGNLTPEAAIDMIGHMQQTQKDLEKAENILWQRLSVLQGGGHQTNSKGVPIPDPGEGDEFKYTLGEQTRTAIDQGRVKTYMESTVACPGCGTVLAVPNFFGSSTVYTKTVRRK